MKLVVFGLTISSAWGNGHATLWRGLCRALHARGHDVVFFERDASYYAAHRDCCNPEGCRLVLYREWSEVLSEARSETEDADAAIVTSYCPDGRVAADLVLTSAPALRVFYDLDTPVTLDRLARGDAVPYLPAEGLGPFDLVLSFTGGRALDLLAQELGARCVAPLYGSVDPVSHHPVASEPAHAADCSYLGTYSDDRQDTLEALFVEPARRRPSLRFTVAGAQYPHDFPWTPNIYFLSHLTPDAHAAFFSSSRLTLNVTRRPMAAMGYCPSGRLFEAAACGTPIISDTWEGLDTFFSPGSEILVANTTDDVLDALAMHPSDLRRVGEAGLARVLACHTASARAAELEALLERSARPLAPAVNGWR